jgi:hypothetical protein
MLRAFQRQQRLLPLRPLFDKPRLDPFEAGIQTGGRFARRFVGITAKSERDDKLIAGRQIKLAGERHVAVRCALVGLSQNEVSRQLLPTVRNADVPRRAFAPGNIGRERQGQGARRRKQHRLAIMLAQPGSIVTPLIAQMRRQQGKQSVVGRAPDQRHEPHTHQHHLAGGISDDFFLDAKPTLAAGVDHAVTGHAIGQVFDLTVRVAFLLAKVGPTVRDDQSQVADARLIDAAEVDLVQDAMTDGEPHSAIERQGRAYAILGARRPARRNARLAGSEFQWVAHRYLERAQTAEPWPRCRDENTGRSQKSRPSPCEGANRVRSLKDSSPLGTKRCPATSA